MEWLALYMETNHGLSVEVDSRRACDVPQRETWILLFWLVRELLFNIAKHAEVDEARPHCRRPADEQVVVEVIDQGKGFDVDGLDGDRTDGFGLYSVRERLDMLGGHLDLDAAPGEGTRATLVLPIDDADADRWRLDWRTGHRGDWAPI